MRRTLVTSGSSASSSAFLSFDFVLTGMASVLFLSTSIAEDIERVTRFLVTRAVGSSGREAVSTDGGGVTSWVLTLKLFEIVGVDVVLMLSPAAAAFWRRVAIMDLYGVDEVLLVGVSSVAVAAEGAWGEENAPISVSGVIMPSPREKPRREGPARAGDTSEGLEGGSEDNSDEKSFSSCFVTSFSSFLGSLSSDSLSSESSEGP